MGLRPCCVEEGILCVEPVFSLARIQIGVMLGGYPYHFSGWIPFAVRPRIYSLPFPTSPKLAEAETAMRESKKGEYFTA
jgi:hypothetical protein